MYFIIYTVLWQIVEKNNLKYWLRSLWPQWNVLNVCKNNYYPKKKKRQTNLYSLERRSCPFSTAVNQFVTNCSSTTVQPLSSLPRNWNTSIYYAQTCEYSTAGRCVWKTQINLTFNNEICNVVYAGRRDIGMRITVNVRCALWMQWQN